MAGIATYRPVVGAAVCAGYVRAGEWVEWRGRFWLCLGHCWLAGPVGERDQFVAPGELVRRVQLAG